MKERLGEQRHNLIVAVAGAISRLTAADHWYEIAVTALGPVCEAANADRAVLVRFVGDGAARCSERVRVWDRPGMPPIISDAAAKLQRLRMSDFEHDVSHHYTVLEQGDALSMEASAALSPPDRWLMSLMQIQTCLRVPILVRDRLWGALGIDTRLRQRLWLDHEILAIWSLGRVLGALIERDGEPRSEAPTVTVP